MFSHTELQISWPFLNNYFPLCPMKLVWYWLNVYGITISDIYLKNFCKSVQKHRRKEDLVEPTSRLRENHNKEKEQFLLKIDSSRTFSCNASSLQQFYRVQVSLIENSLSHTFTHSSSQRQVFRENSCTFDNTQVILLKIVPLRRSRAQAVQTGNQGHFRKIRHSKQRKFTQLYEKCQ